jgi:MerR family transcriptional regulator, thiopeptide resistance regulator
MQAMVAAVEKEMEARAMGVPLTPEEKFEVFGDFDPDQYEEEVQQRWGETDAYAESRRRTASYRKEDWLRITADQDEANHRFVEAMRAGLPADSEQAMDAAEAARQAISRWFYDCPPEMHAALGRMYVEDERFTATYEAMAPGLAQYVSTAVQANAARQGG